MTARIERTDVHRPSAVKPEDYEFVAFEHMRVQGIGDCYAVMENRRRIKAHMDRTGGTYASHEHGGNCMICGASAIWTVLFYHRPSNTYVRTGQDCADKLEMGYGNFNAFRKAVTNALEAQAGKRKAEALLNEAGLSAAWTIFNQSAPEKGWPSEERTIIDVVGKLVKYGSISDKQYNLIDVLLNRIANRAVREAERKAEAERALDVPSGRMTVNGTVLMTRVDDSPFGYNATVVKMLFKADPEAGGYKLWGTCPAHIEKGQHIRLTATLERSDRDPKFGFFKRPKAVVIEEPKPVEEPEIEKPEVVAKNLRDEEVQF